MSKRTSRRGTTSTNAERLTTKACIPQRVHRLIIIRSIEMSSKIQLEFLFEAIERNNRFSKESFQPLVDVFKTRSSGLLEFIKSTQFNKQHARRLFSSLLPLVDFVLDNEKYIPASVLTEDDRKTETTTEIVPDEESSQAMLFIKFTAMMLNAYLDNIVIRRGKEQKNKSTRRDEDILEEVYFLTEKLHGILFELDSFGPEGLQVQKSISSLCEAYWDGHFRGKESVVPQLIPVLVLRTVEDGATKADLKRLWQIKDALFLLDFTQDTISDLKTVILRTLSCPLYVKTVEGRKMIAFFFQLDAVLVKDLHKSMKAQLPLAKGTTLEAYGEIYFRAWKEAASLNSNQVEVDDCDSDDDSSSNNETIQRIIEDNVLQDLMNASLHVASPHMSKTIRCILEPFHSKKSSPEIEKLLFRMYSPIIWRALSAANPMVRINATAIMAQIFPLRDPDAGKLHIQEVHEKTINVLLNLMRDSDPKVRVAGCDAAVNVLGVYWDALSSQHIRALVHEIVAKHAKDAASSAVRAQAVQGVTLLLDAEASHGVLRPLLPFMGDLIHDKVEKVRLATVKLLLKLKTLKGFKYYHVAPSHHILSRLAAEGEGLRNPTGPVAAALTDLLCNSYCPLGVKNSEQMRRTITFLTEAPKAAYVFYSNLSKFYDVASISKFIVMLMKTLQIHVHQNCEDDDTEPDILLFSAMAQTVLTLWTSISKDLEKSENESFLEFVQAAMKGNTLPDMCVYFEKLSAEHADDKKIVNECHKVCASLLHCAGFMSPSSRDELIKKLSEKIQKYCDLEKHERNGMNILPYIAVFCSWGLQDTVADSLCKAISSAFDDEHSGTSFEVKSKLSRKRKPVSEANDVNGAEFSETIRRMPSDVAIYIVDQVLTGSHSSNMLVRDAFLSSEIISDKISSSLFKATASAEKIMNGSIISLHSDHHVKLVLSACETYTRFAIHKEATSDGPLKLNQQLVSLLIWLTDRAVPVICAKRGRSSCSPFKDVDLSVIGGRDSMSPVPTSPIAVPPPRRRSNMTESTNMDSTFDIMEPHSSEIIFDHIESSVSVYAMAVHLVRSALVLFSEWIVLGGSGSDKIAEHAKAWSKIFSCSFSNIDIPAEIFPSYCRLCTIIASYSLDFSLVEDAIQIAQEFNEDELSVALQYVRKSLMYFFPQHKDKKNAELPASLQRVLNESV